MPIQTENKSIELSFPAAAAARQEREPGGARLSYGITGETFIKKPLIVKKRDEKRFLGLTGRALALKGVKYLFYFGSMLALWLSRVNGLAPFSSGLYYALLFLGQNVFILTPLYILSAFIAELTLEAFLSALLTGTVLLAVSVGFKAAKKKPNLFVLMGAGAVGQIGYTVFSFLAGAMVLTLFLNLVFSLLFFYVAVCGLRPIFRFKLKYRLLDVELACLGITVAAAAIGIASLEINGFRFLYLIAFFSIALIAYLAGKGAGIVTGLCFGIGGAFYSYDVTAIALLGFVAVCCVIFLSAPRVLTGLAAVFALALFELFFNVEYQNLPFDVLSLSIGALLFAALPRGLLENLKSYYFQSHNKLAARHLVNRGRSEVADDLAGIAGILREMGSLLKPERRSLEQKGEDAGAAVIAEVCAHCEKFAACSERGLKNAVEELAVSTLKNGRAFVTDLPALLELGCTRIARMIAYTHTSLVKRLESDKKRDADERLKNELAAQLDAVGGIIGAAADRVGRPVSYDLELERIVLEELAYHDVICSEVLITRGQETSVTLIARTECVKKDETLAVLQKLLKIRLTPDAEAASPVAGYSVLSYRQKTVYDALFGVASAAKEREATGDLHSFIKIGSDKFLMALSDGMGSGKSAQRVSEAAISLVESFYRAGFDSDIILSSVNRFLIYAEGEIFSAMDILVADLNTLSCDIIKIGTPSSYVKRRDSVIRLDGSSLPMGMVGEMTPFVDARRLNAGDLVVFVSDGVSDCFAGDALADLINNQSGLNPKALADTILEQAVRANGGARADDMTVLACRLFER
ncbi:MAG: SpoIIE family protein phosphatase [Clostridiales bacterium]|jgi:stage II sporulation protein E|nr:SpoIIE family protein phosphatase [Clostridiales bacterium]